MKTFNVKMKINVSDDCMDTFYDNDPKKVCDEVKWNIWNMYNARNAGMFVLWLEAEAEEVEDEV